MQDPPLPASRRYHPDRWGKHGHSKGGRGNRKRAASTLEEEDEASPLQMEADAKWDLASCRALLVALPADDVRDRLSRSPWSRGKVPNEINWLKEVASAFAVSISQAGGASTGYKLKGTIIKEIMD